MSQLKNELNNIKYDKFINTQNNTAAWLEYSPVCTKIVDLDFNLKYMSRAGIEAIGVEDITVFYDKPYPVEIYPQPYRDTWIACFKHAKDTGEIIARDIIAIANDGREIWFDSTFIPVNDDSGDLQYIIVTSENITERIAAEKQLQELNKNLEQRVKEEVEKNRLKDKQVIEQSKLAQIGEMLSMIAHQWRQPLGAISTTAIGIETKLMLNKYDLSKEKDRNKFKLFLSSKLKDINTFVGGLSSTIDDFRNFFKPDKNKEVVFLSELINRALKIVQTSMSSKNISITTNLKHDEKLLIYQNEVMHVILNILKNSKDNFIAKDVKNRKIDISTYKEEKIADENSNLLNNLIISIQDNGGGIPQDILPNIFNPYFSTKDEKNGTGLGLYMSKTMIEEHNHGKLIVENIKNGVLFKIELEIYDED